MAGLEENKREDLITKEEQRILAEQTIEKTTEAVRGVNAGIKKIEQSMSNIKMGLDNINEKLSEKTTLKGRPNEAPKSLIDHIAEAKQGVESLGKELPRVQTRLAYLENKKGFLRTLERWISGPANEDKEIKALKGVVTKYEQAKGTLGIAVAKLAEFKAKSDQIKTKSSEAGSKFSPLASEISALKEGNATPKAEVKTTASTAQATASITEARARASSTPTVTSHTTEARARTASAPTIASLTGGRSSFPGGYSVAATVVGQERRESAGQAATKDQEVTLSGPSLTSGSK